MVNKAAQLIQHQTTNLSESYMSVRSKLDGGKFYNRVQSGSFQTRCTAAALRLQLGPGWAGEFWQRRIGTPNEVQIKLGLTRKRKHELDTSRKHTAQYKRQRLLKRRKGTAQQDSTYGKDAAEPEVEPEVLKSMCEDYLTRLHVSSEEALGIAERTALQADDDTGEWITQRKGRLTSSRFGEVAKRRAALAPLTKRFLYGRTRDTPAIRYGRQNEPQARLAYEQYLQTKHPKARVDTTGINIDLTNCWLAASPDGLVIDPTTPNPEGLLEIKCPYRAKDKPLVDICTDSKQKSSFFMEYNSQTGTFTLKRNHSYYYQVQGQLHVMGRSWCDFYVWTPRVGDRVVERIVRDTAFWNSIFPSLRRFYYGSLLPELVNPRHPSGQEIREFVDWFSR